MKILHKRLRPQLSQSVVMPGEREKRRAIAGFTLMELLIVIGMIGAIATVAIPSLSALRQQTSLRNAHTQMMSDLKMARLMAVTKNRTVTVTLGTTAPYNYVVDYTMGGTAVTRSVFMDSFGSGITLSGSGIATITFNSNSTAGGNQTISLSSGGRTKKLVVNMIGRIYDNS